jgi:hypothetical protein
LPRLAPSGTPYGVLRRRIRQQRDPRPGGQIAQLCRKIKADAGRPAEHHVVNGLPPQAGLQTRSKVIAMLHSACAERIFVFAESSFLP